jgi:adenylate cyclase
VAAKSATRKLAAILAADVVGYSRLVRADEEGTLAALKGFRDTVIDPKIAEHHGRVVKLMGDGLLAEFASAVDAVRSAVELQQAAARHQADVPEDRRIVLRVGINLGDVVVEGDDIHGDGVNVASRLEALSEPGGICISGKVYEEIRDRIAEPFEDEGERTVKNIDRPVRIWRWRNNPLGSAARTVQASVPSRPNGRPSIAVLPFDNLSGDPEQEYFADGMVEEIITGLSRIHWLTVIARNSSFVYKGKSPDLRAVGRELGVGYVLEGSVRKAGERVRIATQLIETEAGGHLWADKFDGSLADVFDLQDQITAGVVGAIEPSVRKAEIERAKRKRPDNLSAYDLYLRALAHMHQVTPEGRIAALDLIDQALALDPNYAEAHGVAAWCYFARSMWEDGLPETYRDKAIHHARAIQRLQTEDASTLAHGAIALGVATNDYASALEMINRAIAINPSSVHAYGHGAVINTLAGNYQTAIELAERSLRLSPFDPLSVMPIAAMAGAQLKLGDYDAAVASARRALQIYPTHVPSHIVAIAGLVKLGRTDEARAFAARLLEIAPGISVSSRQPIFRDQFGAELREAGLPE